ncbi:MAG: hypothetical protein ABJG42_24615 [Vibrio splendidus]
MKQENKYQPALDEIERLRKLAMSTGKVIFIAPRGKKKKSLKGFELPFENELIEAVMR